MKDVWDAVVGAAVDCFSLFKDMKACERPTGSTSGGSAPQNSAAPTVSGSGWGKKMVNIYKSNHTHPDYCFTYGFINLKEVKTRPRCVKINMKSENFLIPKFKTDINLCIFL